MENAIIDYTKLFLRGNMLTFTIHMKIGDRKGQGFGGYVLYHPENKTGFCGNVIFDILKALEVNSWEELPNTPIRVVQHDSTIVRIGHFLKQQWFNLGMLSAQYD